MVGLYPKAQQSTLQKGSYLSRLSHFNNLSHPISSFSFRTDLANEPELEHDLFLKAVSPCHVIQISNVQTDGTGDGPGQSSLAPFLLEFYASSPDVKALVEATARIGRTTVAICFYQK